MIDLYFWTTPNGYKPLLLLEEAGLPYRIKPVDIGAGEQFAPEFLRISPNNRIPAIVDHDPAGAASGDAAGATAPISIFESGAILLYLAEKTGAFLPADPAGRAEVLQWLFWQVAGLGPMAGQNHHFAAYAPQRIPYAVDRYVKETARLYAVLDRRLAEREFIAGDYSIADMASYPWIVPHRRQRIDLGAFPNVQRWYAAIGARPATLRAYAAGQAINTTPTVTDASRKVLFGQDAVTIAA
jgi:GST-like protein